jgi:RimJ/RimL family protein N-acetyltransferase
MPLEGERLLLREERPADIPFEAGLRNDLETQAWPKALPPDYTEAMYRKRFEGREFSMDRREARFIIELKETHEQVGYISYYDLEPRFSVTYGLAVLKKFWGTGLAAEAQAVLLKFLFVELGMRVVRLWTTSGNPAMIRLAEKGGFKLSGRVRQSAFRSGELYDGITMDILREEYFTRHPELADNLPSL